MEALGGGRGGSRWYSWPRKCTEADASGAHRTCPACCFISAARFGGCPATAPSHVSGCKGTSPASPWRRYSRDPWFCDSGSFFYTWWSFVILHLINVIAWHSGEFSLKYCQLAILKWVKNHWAASSAWVKNPGLASNEGDLLGGSEMAEWGCLCDSGFELASGPMTLWLDRAHRKGSRCFCLSEEGTHQGDLLPI